jgi:hypothetical protein
MYSDPLSSSSHQRQRRCDAEHFLFFVKIIVSQSVFRLEGERKGFVYGITVLAACTACRTSEKGVGEEVGDGAE